MVLPLVKAFCISGIYLTLFVLFQCVNPSVALGAFCDWTTLNWNTVNSLSIELIQLYAIVKKQDSPQLFEFCSR